MTALNKVWRRFEPEIPFEARFVDDVVHELYAADRARTILFAGFSLLAVVIACLGLYSLAAFTAERRTREIGIRKVFGARVRDIVRLLAWQFSKPVVIANVLPGPSPGGRCATGSTRSTSASRSGRGRSSSPA